MKLRGMFDGNLGWYLFWVLCLAVILIRWVDNSEIKNVDPPEAPLPTATAAPSPTPTPFPSKEAENAYMDGWADGYDVAMEECDEIAALHEDYLERPLDYDERF